MTLLTFKTSFYRSGFPARVTSALKVQYFNKVVFLSVVLHFSKDSRSFYPLFFKYCLRKTSRTLSIIKLRAICRYMDILHKVLVPENCRIRRAKFSMQQTENEKGFFVDVVG